MPPALLKTIPIHEGWSRYMRVTVRLEDGAEVEREVEDHGRAVSVLPYDPERKTALLVRQLRMGPLVAGDPDPFLLEAPAGIIEDEGPEASAKREALEEVGVRLTALEPIGAPYSTAGVSTERIELFLAAYAQADRTQSGGGLDEEHETIKVLELPLGKLWERIDAGEIRDLKTIALVAVLKVRRPELFA